MTSSWIPGVEGHPFGMQTLPYGVLLHGDRRVPVVRIGDFGVDLFGLCSAVLPARRDLFAAQTLDPFLRAGPEAWTDVRAAVGLGLSEPAYRNTVEPLLIPLADGTPVLPFAVADYVDFYASENHAGNVGRIFRPDSTPLPPNWKHLPIGYHGRAGTVVVSGTDIVRPHGQRRVGDHVEFGPSIRLDIEAEIGFVVGVGSELGSRVTMADFGRHVFGVVVLNDWSARDIQSWETVPLGPFLGKSFATSISAWITPLAALESARRSPPDRVPRPMDYLDDSDEPWALDLELEIRLNDEVISRPPFSSMYWTAPQMLAHMTVNGAALRSGDLYGSGTVSGPERTQRGSLLELSWGGSEPFTTSDGRAHTFLENGDEVVIAATAAGPGERRVQLAEVRGRIAAAR